MKSSPIQSKFPQKPECSYGEVIATDRGWEVVQPGGGKEILVSCLNLKSMIDADAGLEPEATITIPEPVVITDPPPAYSESELAAIKEKEEQRLASEKAAQDALLNPPEGGTGAEGGQGSTSEGGEGSTGEGATGEGATGGEGTTGGDSDKGEAGKGDETVALYTKDGLMALKMDEVRAVGKTFSVADTSKEALVDKIIAAQAAAEAAKTA